MKRTRLMMTVMLLFALFIASCARVAKSVGDAPAAEEETPAVEVSGYEFQDFPANAQPATVTADPVKVVDDTLFHAKFEGDAVSGSGGAVGGKYHFIATQTDGESWHVKLEANYPTVAGRDYSVTYRFTSDVSGKVKFGDFQEFEIKEGENTVTGIFTAKDSTSYLDLQLGMLQPFTIDFTEIEVKEYADEVRAMRNGGIFDDEELEKMMEDFITAHKLKKENISIGFVYTATGDTWYYNPDTWYYPGSMYKIPLMMLLAEQVSSGMLTQDGPFEGMTVSQYEEHILTYSNNDYAHRMRAYLGEGDDKVWRKAAQAYANMPEDSYNPDYMDYSYFSARYLTEVLTTLYNGGEERFPNIIPCMKKANPNHYFALSSQMADYEIAQKYGSFIDNNNRNWNGTAGIIYTPNRRSTP